MECVACHAPLRADARFCNVCGARQPAGVPEAVGGGPGPAAEEDSDAPQRRPRPPRVPRSPDLESDDGQASAQPTADDDARRPHATLPIPPDAAAIATAWDAGQQQGTDVAEWDTTTAPTVAPEEAQDASLAPSGDTPERMPGEDREDATHEAAALPTMSAPEGTTATEVERADSEHEQRDARVASDTVSSMAPASDALSALDAGSEGHAPAAEGAASAEAVPGDAPPMARAEQGSGASQTATPDASAPRADEAETQIRDSLPWPLVSGLIVGGRYRVEEVVEAARISVGAENVYRATDLRGYERCWSCGAAQDENATHERYCRVCDADLLDYPLRLSERLLDANGRAEDDAARDAATPEQASAPVTYPHTFTQGQREYTVTPLREATPAFLKGVRVVGALASDVGLAHSGEANEDSVTLIVLQHPTGVGSEGVALALVADGLGGHSDGQEASRLASRVIAEDLLTTILAPRLAAEASAAQADSAEDDALAREALHQAASKANSTLCALNAERSTNMGTTLVAALVLGTTAYILWAGDSRAYSFADGALRRLTTDHSLVEQLVAGGLIAPEERYTHDRRNEIYRSLGTDQSLETDSVIQRLTPGMRLLLCSDGLWEMVRDDDIARILAEARHPQAAVDRLVARANEHGGEDNICAVLIEVSG